MLSLKRICRAAMPCAVLLFSVLCGAAADRQGDSDPMAIEARDTFDDMTRELDLTGEQAASINRIKAEHVKKMKAIKRQIASKYDAIAQEILKDDQDKKLVNGLKVEIEDLEIQYVDERLSLLKDIKGFLTERQLLKLDALNRKKRGETNGNTKRMPPRRARLPFH